MISMITPEAIRQLETTPEKPTLLSSPVKTWTLLLLVFLAVHFAALFSPSLLDDADATHANAAQHMATSGDWLRSTSTGFAISKSRHCLIGWWRLIITSLAITYS